MKTILIVEDDRDLTDLLGTALELSGYEVETAVNGAAIPLAQEARPDVILLDIQMPGMDGIQVAQRLRADERTRDIPIVLMSAGYRLDERGREVQVERLLPKPFDLNVMLDYVDELAGP
jgi:CheY-like chemotaxis protein